MLHNLEKVDLLEKNPKNALLSYPSTPLGIKISLLKREIFKSQDIKK